VAVHPLRPATHRRLGRPLPHQLANGPQAHPQAEQLLLSSKPQKAKTSCGITPCFHGLFPTQRQITYVLLTRSPLSPQRLPPRVPVRLACLRRAASVSSEPGSNSPLYLFAPHSEEQEAIFYHKKHFPQLHSLLLKERPSPLPYQKTTHTVCGTTPFQVPIPSQVSVAPLFSKIYRTQHTPAPRPRRAPERKGEYTAPPFFMSSTGAR
jgi:hypothetical protein